MLHSLPPRSKEAAQGFIAQLAVAVVTRGEMEALWREQQNPRKCPVNGRDGDFFACGLVLVRDVQQTEEGRL